MWSGRLTLITARSELRVNAKMPRTLLSRRVDKANKANPETNRYLLQPMSGEINQMVVVSMHPSLTALDKWRKKRQADPELQALGKELNDSEWYVGHTRRHFEVVE